MQITLQKSNQLKAIAVLMMLFLHLFNKPYEGLFTPLLFIGKQPLSYYISLFSDACVPIFAFVSGYGLFFKYNLNPENYNTSNFKRIIKLYINYWLILILFCVLLGRIIKPSIYLGSTQEFILNFLSISNSYNSTWWFLFIYLFLVFTSKPIFEFITNKHWFIVFSILIFIYTFGFYFMVYKNNISEQLWLNKIINIIARYCYALFPFVSGAMFYKCKDFKVLDKIKNKNSYAILLIILMIIFHGFFPNLYFSAYLALAFVVCIIHLDFPKIVNDILEYLSHHSTNIWLVHMFFYAIFFSKYIYYPKYVILIFLFLVLCSLISSIIINKIYKLIIKKIF